MGGRRQNLAFSSILLCPFKIGTPTHGEMGYFIYRDMEGLLPESLISSLTSQGTGYCYFVVVVFVLAI